ncbi:MAG: phosphopantetheine-binding protein [Pseudomonas sp.]|jgi:acyl carrier protein|uniref:acyl carrier protein n=1 Tax=Pseudomonas sp. TaxID=306 RepID=UPI0023920D6B|nr:phosphopantetheine-binding protein [Pseudomonas sp.]MDE1196464.1 phosphopantetheine-binding protein [Pseudomonas sp.]
MNATPLAVIADYFLREPNELLPHLHLIDDLGADSLEILEITEALNERLGIDIPERQLAHIRTVGELCALAHSQIR